jgi:hypothetical protein
MALWRSDEMQDEALQSDRCRAELAAACLMLTIPLPRCRPRCNDKVSVFPLAGREKQRPDSWLFFNAKSLLGGSLLGQEKYAGAEPLLLDGYAGMKKQEALIPPQGEPLLSEALQRLVQLYEATGKMDEAARWRKELAAPKARESKHAGE